VPRQLTTAVSSRIAGAQSVGRYLGGRALESRDCVVAITRIPRVRGVPRQVRVASSPNGLSQTSRRIVPIAAPSAPIGVEEAMNRAQVVVGKTPMSAVVVECLPRPAPAWLSAAGSLRSAGWSTQVERRHEVRSRPGRPSGRWGSGLSCRKEEEASSSHRNSTAHL